MKYILSLLLLSLYVPYAAANGDSAPGHTHEHHHDQLEVSGYNAVPGVALEVARDEMSGWNLHLITTNFRFAPEKVNTTPVAGEGHAHIYVDGNKVARLYGPWFHLADQAPGPHTILVTLNANNHAELALDGVTIAASAAIEQ